MHPCGIKTFPFTDRAIITIRNTSAKPRNDLICQRREKQGLSKESSLCLGPRTEAWYRLRLMGEALKTAGLWRKQSKCLHMLLPDSRYNHWALAEDVSFRDTWTSFQDTPQVPSVLDSQPSCPKPSLSGRSPATTLHFSFFHPKLFYWHPCKAIPTHQWGHNEYNHRDISQVIALDSL